MIIELLDMKNLYVKIFFKALEACAEYDYIDIVRLLIKAKADLNSKNKLALMLYLLLLRKVTIS